MVDDCEHGRESSPFYTLMPLIENLLFDVISGGDKQPITSFVSRVLGVLAFFYSLIKKKNKKKTCLDWFRLVAVGSNRLSPDNKYLFVNGITYYNAFYVFLFNSCGYKFCYFFRQPFFCFNPDLLFIPFKVLVLVLKIRLLAF